MKKITRILGIIAISAIIAIGLVACPDDSKPTLTLTPASVTIGDNSLTAPVAVGGTTKGDVTLDVTDLPTGVTAAVDGTTITVTGVRPTTENGSINDSYTVGVTREGVTKNLTVVVNLTTTFNPSSPTVTLTPASVTINDGNLTATVTVGGTATGAVTLGTTALPTGVTAAVDGTTITVTGVRPTEESATAITGNNLVVVVTRGGVNQNLSVTVNLTTTWTAGGGDEPCECCGEDCECADCDDGGCTECAPDPCEDGCTFTEWAVTTAATCTADGVETEKCEVCGELGTETRSIPATGHTIVDGVCTVCGFEEGSDPCEDGHDHTESLVCLNCDHQYELGDTGPGGGVIYYIATEGFDVEGYGADDTVTGYFAGYKAHYLEVAPANAHTTTVRWRGSASANVLIPATTEITTFTSTTTQAELANKIGNGRKDTQIIVAFYADITQSTNATEVTDTAANYAANYSEGEKSDWFLPSLGELNLLYQSTSAVSGMPESGYFWSSSQDSSTFAWIQNFSNGGRISSYKNGNGSVRSVRAF